MDIIRAPGNINLIASSSDSLEPLLHTSPSQPAKPKDNNPNGAQQQFKQQPQPQPPHPALPKKDHQHHHSAEEQHQQQQHQQHTSGRNGLKSNVSNHLSTPAPGSAAAVATGTKMPSAGGGPLRQTPQCSSTDSGNGSCGSGGSAGSCGSASASVSGGGGAVADPPSVDEPETINQSTNSVTVRPEVVRNPIRSLSSSSLKKRNLYVNKTYDRENGAVADGAAVAAACAPGSAVVSIDEGIDACSEGSKVERSTAFQRYGGADRCQRLDDEQPTGTEEEAKPLLELTNERRGRPKTKGIVKSPSSQSFGDKPPRVLSLQFSRPESVIVVDRPVHHVQFSSSKRSAHADEGGEDRVLLVGQPGLGDPSASGQMCSSPVGSILSNGSAGSSSSSGTSSSSSSSSNENSSLGAYAEARPPDGGWGWVVCFASFMVNLIADGVTFSFGVMYMELLSYFGEGKGKTAWVGSLFMAMPLLCGPVASFLTDRYGCRKVTIIGSILASVGFALSAYATSIEMLYLTFGILSGFGLSLCYVAAVVIVAYYFDKKRSFATGLSVCGSGIGTFVFASLTQVLLDEYGWRGTTLILAGVFLNMCLCGLLMRDLEWTTHKSKQKRRKQQQQQADSVSNSTNTAGNASVLMNGGIVDGNGGGIIGGNGGILPDGVNEHLHDLDDPRLFSSLITLPTYLQNGAASEKIPLEVLAMLSKQHNVHNHHVLQDFPTVSLNNSRSFSQPLSPQAGEEPGKQTVDQKVDVQQHHDGEQQDQNGQGQEQWTNEANGATDEKVVPRSRQRAAGGQRTGARGRNSAAGQKQHPIATQYDHEGNPLPPVFLRRVHSHSIRGTAPTAAAAAAATNASTASYLKDLRMHRHSLTYRGAMLNIQRYRLRASSCPDIYRNSMTTIAKEKSAWYQGVEEFRTLLVSILDFSYFSDVHYLLFAISNFLLYTFYDVPYVYLGDNATQIGFSHTQSSMLIAIIGILNMVGEIVLGWMGDRKSVNANYTYAICMALCGLVTAMVPLFKDYTSLSVLAGGFGLFIAANYSLTSIILVELITLERFTNAYGLLLLVQGVANLVGPPLAGWISDLTESYDLSFYLAGFFIVISGLLLLILPTIGKVRKMVDKRRQSSSASANGDKTNPSKKNASGSYQPTKPLTLDLKTTYISNGKGTGAGTALKRGSTPIGLVGDRVFGPDSKHPRMEAGANV